MDEILDLIWSVSEGFPIYSCKPFILFIGSGTANKLGIVILALIKITESLTTYVVFIHLLHFSEMALMWTTTNVSWRKRNIMFYSR